MKLQALLYYRYLFRQTSITLIVALIIVATITLLLYFLQDFSPQNIWVFSGGIAIWICPFLLLILMLNYLRKFLHFKKENDHLKLYQRLTNQRIRQAITKSQTRISIWSHKPEQLQNFNKAIAKEIEKQKTLIKIQEGVYLNEGK